jgi:hypothetical protein
LEDVGSPRLVTPIRLVRGYDDIQRRPTGGPVLAKHLTAETKVEEFVQAKGLVVPWGGCGGRTTGSTGCTLYKDAFWLVFLVPLAYVCSQAC